MVLICRTLNLVTIESSKTPSWELIVLSRQNFTEMEGEGAE